MIRPPLISTLFPYTTLFRSLQFIDLILGAPAQVQDLFREAGEYPAGRGERNRSEEHTSELQSLRHLVCRLLLEKKKKNTSSCVGHKPQNVDQSMIVAICIAA